MVEHSFILAIASQTPTVLYPAHCGDTVTEGSETCARQPDLAELDLGDAELTTVLKSRGVDRRPLFSWL